MIPDRVRAGHRMLFFARALLFSLVLTGLAGTLAARERYAADFDSGRVDRKHLVEAHPHFTPRDGFLRARAEHNRRPRMNVLPILGRNADFTIDARWVSGQKITVDIKADYRYRTSSPYVSAWIALDRNFAVLKGAQKQVKRGLSFRKNQWYRIRVSRRGERASMYIDGQKIAEVPLLSKRNRFKTSPRDAAYGGFSFGINTNPGEQVVDFDNLVVEGDVSPVPFYAHNQPFRMDGRAYNFYAIYEKGYERWAVGQAEVTIPFLKKARRIFGTPPVTPNIGMVQARGEYYEGGSGTKGSNHGGYVTVQAHLRKRYRANRHEHSHNWSYLYRSSWAKEGTAEIPSWVMRERQGRLVTSLYLVRDFYYSGYHEKAILANPELYEFDMNDNRIYRYTPTSGRLRERGYLRGGLLIYILLRRLGLSGFQRLNRYALSDGAGATAEQMKSYASRVLGRDATPIFAGWTHPGRPLYSIRDAVLDDDRDGLSNLDELLLGTNPRSSDSDGDRVADLAEIEAGYDPTARSDVPRHIVVDGSDSDWASLGAPEQDPRDGTGNYDLRFLNSVVDEQGQNLYVLVSFYPGAKPLRDGHITLDIESSGDNHTDRRVNLFLGGSSNAWDVDRNRAQKRVRISSKGIKFVYNEASGIAEARIPLSITNYSGRLRLYVHGRSGSNRDKFKGWRDVRNVRRFAVRSGIWLPRR